MSNEYRKYVEGEIAARCRRLEELETEKIKVSSEMLAYENMRQHLVDGETDAPAATPPIREAPPAKRTGFQMSPTWAAILRSLDSRGRSFNAADMISAAESLGTKVTVQNARSQIAHYSKPKSGLLRRVQAGRYTFTAKGKDMLKNEGDRQPLKPSNGSAALADSPSSTAGLAGEAATSPNESRDTRKGSFD